MEDGEAGTNKNPLVAVVGEDLWLPALVTISEREPRVMKGTASAENQLAKISPSVTVVGIQKNSNCDSVSGSEVDASARFPQQLSHAHAFAAIGGGLGEGRGFRGDIRRP